MNGQLLTQSSVMNKLISLHKNLRKSFSESIFDLDHKFKKVVRTLTRFFSAPKGQVSNDTSLVLLKEKVEKQKELEEAMRTAAQMQKQLELQINTLNAQLAEEKEKVAQLSSELEAHKLESAGTLKASEEEILELRKK